MQNNLQIFRNPQFGEIRTAGSAENPLFCAVDIARALQYSNPAKAVIDHCKGVTVLETPTNGGLQPVKFIAEGDMYRLIFKSNAPKADEFVSWVADDVLPSIRKTGGYIQTTSEDSDSDIMAKALMIAQKTIERREQQVQMLQLENSHLKDENKQLAPAAQYTEDVLLAKECMTFTQAAKALNFKSAQALIKRLISDKVIYKQSGQYLPASRYSGKGYTATRVARFFHRDGTPGTTSSTVWTQAGMQFLHSKYNA